MNNTCKTCRAKFEGEAWKTQCWDCWKDFKDRPRIAAVDHGRGPNWYIMAHPSVTEEEVNEYIKKKWPEALNWGAVELTGKNMKVWWNCQYDD